MNSSTFPETVAFKPVRVLSLRFHLQAKQTIRLPLYSGSAWKGLFGHALKKAVCVTHTPHCKDCAHYHSCVHSIIFEAPVPVDTLKMRRYPSAPHPYVIRPSLAQRRLMSAGESTWIDIFLFGNCTRYASYIVQAIQAAGDTGVGESRGKFSVTNITQLNLDDDMSRLAYQPQTHYLDSQNIPAPPGDTVTIQLNTPLRLRINKHYLNPETFSARAFFSTLLRRYSMLSYFQEAYDPPLDYKALLEISVSLKISNARLKWQDLKRYSSRQKKEVPMGGIIGQFELSGAQLHQLWPLLWHGQALHLGKGTVMGLGQYTLITPQACGATDQANNASSLCNE